MAAPSWCPCGPLTPVRLSKHLAHRIRRAASLYDMTVPAIASGKNISETLVLRNVFYDYPLISRKKWPSRGNRRGFNREL